MPSPVKKSRKSDEATAADRLNAAANKASKQQREPLWEGPAGAGPNGGVTQSLIGRWLSDGERCRVQFVEGWNPPDRFEPRREFGNMWHAAEQAHAAGVPAEEAIGACAEKLCRKHQTDRTDIVFWAEKCAALWGRYLAHWHSCLDQRDKQPLFQEQVFDVPYRLPSGRSVRLRGKWDGACLLGGGVWLDEHKTKSSVDSVALVRLLSFDLQTMLYLIALGQVKSPCPSPSGPTLILGVRYNVVRRPAHKSVENMLKKVDEDRRNGRAGEWFARFEVRVSPEDVARFRREFLDPALENLFDDWEWWDDCMRHGPEDGYAVYDHEVRAEAFPHHVRRHFRFPYGVYNPLTEGGTGEVDELINSGSTAGLRRSTKLFEELI